MMHLPTKFENEKWDWPPLMDMLGKTTSVNEIRNKFVRVRNDSRCKPYGLSSE